MELLLSKAFEAHKRIEGLPVTVFATITYNIRQAFITESIAQPIRFMKLFLVVLMKTIKFVKNNLAKYVIRFSPNKNKGTNHCSIDTLALSDIYYFFL